MKLSILLFGLWLFSVQNIWCQKDLSRVYFAEGIENISIDGNGVHSLRVMAAKVKEITVKVHLEGETSEEIVINEQIEDNQLVLGFGLWPLAKTYNDKLSAHKIISVVATIFIPENLFVSITSNTAAVFVEGTFEFLYVDIEDGDCVLDTFNGSADLKTKRGAIFVTTTNLITKAAAKTTYGTLQNKLGNKGIITIYAESVHGDITLLKTQ
jgi:hypothetical protein